jgi:hypothetical protein
MSNKLRPCPFCGLPNARVKKAYLPTLTTYTVACLCGARCANYTTRRAAVASWNGVMQHKTKKECQ